jgi:hypothetical protein
MAETLKKTEGLNPEGQAMVEGGSQRDHECFGMQLSKAIKWAGHPSE